MAIEAFRLMGVVSVDTRGAETNLDRVGRKAKQTHTEIGRASKSKVNVDTSGAEHNLDRLERKAKSLKSSLGSAGDFLSRTGANILGNLATSAISGGIDKMGDLTKRGMEYYDTVQMARVGFKSLMGDQKQAEDQIKSLLGFARRTPYEDAPVLKYAQSLQAVGVEAQKVEGYLTGVGNALAGAVNFTEGGQNRAMTALTQMLGKPTIMAEELKSQLGDVIPSAVQDMAAALKITVEDLRQGMEAGQIKSGPAVELLVRYWNQQRAGLMQFAGENTFSGLTSTRQSSEDRAMANIFAGGDVMNPSTEGAGAERLRALQEEIKRRDKFAEGGSTQNALGSLATAYLKAREADDAFFFGALNPDRADQSLDAQAARFGGDWLQNFLKSKPMAGGVPGPASLGSSLYDTLAASGVSAHKMGPTGAGSDLYTALIGDKPLLDVPKLVAAAVGTSISHIEAGMPVALKAGAGLGNSLIEGMKSPEGLDTHSPSKKAEHEGEMARLGFIRGITGVTDPTLDVFGAAALVGMEGIAGLQNGRSGGARLGGNPLDRMSQAQIENARKVIEVGKSRGESPERIQLALSTAWVESKFKNYEKAVDYDSLGIMQQRPSVKDKSGRPYWGTPAQLKDPAYAANRWYTEADKKDRGQEPGTLGWQVQNPRKDLRGLYGQSMGIAGQIYSALTSGGAEVSRANPMPVIVTDFGNGVPVNFNRGSQPVTTDFGNGEPVKFAREVVQDFGKMITDTVPVLGGVIEEFNLLDAGVTTLGTTLQLKAIQPLEKFGLAVSTAAAGVKTDEQLRADAFGGGKATPHKRDKLFDSQLTREGLATDFQGNVQGFLSGDLLHGKFFKDHILGGLLMPMLKDMQGRAGHDLSASLTEMLFGGRRDPNDPKSGLAGGLLGGLFGSLFGGGKKGGVNLPPLQGLAAQIVGGGSGGASGGGIGGFFKNIFGSLFGGFRAEGGAVDSGKFYRVGERGEEWFAPGVPGHIIPNHARPSAGGGTRQQQAQRNLRLIMVDDERSAREHYNTSDEAFMLQISRNRHELISMFGR